MSVDILAEWLHRQGHRIIRTDRSHWYDAAPGVYQAFPYHRLIEPSNSELAQVWRQRAIGLRYSTALSAAIGHISYHVIYSGDGTYTESQLPKKARYDVRRGLEYAVVEQISMARLASEGWILRAQTLARQGRTRAETEAWWRRLCLSTDGLSNFEAWGAIQNGQLVAALLGFMTDDCYSVFYQQSLTEHLKYSVNNALTFVVTQHALQQPGIAKVFYGLHSLDAPSSVDQFKFRMGYRAEPVRQRVEFHPWLRPFVNKMSYAFVKRFQTWNPSSPLIAKTEGMLRFYLEGKRPLESQHWPECLASQNSEEVAT
jgi:hypothetical protein